MPVNTASLSSRFVSASPLTSQTRAGCCTQKRPHKSPRVVLGCINREQTPSKKRLGVQFAESQLLLAVEQCSKSNMRGTQGTWQEFILQMSSPSSRTQPCHQSEETLAAFLTTLSPLQAKLLLESQGKWHRLDTQRAAFHARLLQRQLPQLKQEDIWSLVLMTMSHPKFPQTLQALPSEGRWTQNTQGLDVESAPTLLSLDCEMCITSHNMRELIGLSIVNSSGKCVLKMLVKPQGRVRDWRTIVTGVDKTSMQGVIYTKRDAREAVKKLLQGNVVLVGHSVHHDLEALQLYSAVFVDTALLYFFADGTSGPPSLANLASQVLGQSLRQEGAAHNCEDDTAATMQLVKHALQYGIPQDLQAPPKKMPAVYGNAAFAELPAEHVVDDLGRAEKRLSIMTGTGHSKIIKIYKMPDTNT